MSLRINLTKNITTLLLSGFCLLLIACGGNKKEDKNKEGSKSPIQADKVVGIGRIEPEGKLIDLSAEVNGIIEKIYINEGQHADKGQIIISLTDGVQKSNLSLNQSRIETQLKQIESAKANYEAQKIQTINSRKDYERNKKMFEAGAVTQQSFDNVMTSYEIQKQNEASALAQIALAEKQLKEIYQEINVAKNQLEQRYIKAPETGTVLSLDVNIGSEVNPNTSFGQYARDGKTIALCEIDELFANKIKDGQDAFIRTQGGTDTLAWGKVTFAAPSLKKKSLFADQVGDQEDRRVREVQITIDPQYQLIYGSRIDCVILLNQKVQAKIK